MMIKSAFMLGAGLGIVGGMFLVKMCPKAEQIVDDVKGKFNNRSSKGCDCGCGCGQEQEEQN